MRTNVWVFVTGLLSMLPVTYGAYFFAKLLPSLTRAASQPTEPSRYSVMFNSVFAAGVGVAALTLVLVILYLLLLYRPGGMKLPRRGLLALGLLAANVLVFPVYWYLLVWRNAMASNPREGLNK